MIAIKICSSQWKWIELVQKALPSGEYTLDHYLRSIMHQSQLVEYNEGKIGRSASTFPLTVKDFIAVRNEYGFSTFDIAWR